MKNSTHSTGQELANTICSALGSAVSGEARRSLEIEAAKRRITLEQLLAAAAASAVLEKFTVTRRERT